MALPVIEARGISVIYRMIDRVTNAVNGVDLTIPEGHIVGLAGGTGVGKSSLALALLKLVRHPGRITAGTCMFEGRDLLSASEEVLRSIRGKQIGLVVQNPRAALNPMLSVGAQIVDVYRAHTGATRTEARRRGVDMLGLMGINDPERRFHAYPHELSGGMAQRAVIAMALVCEPRVLIADEPTSGVDVTIQAQILDDLARSARETGSAVLLVTQNLGILANYCDRSIVMHAGLVVEAASVREFFDHPLHPSSRLLLAEQQDMQWDRRGRGSFDSIDAMDGCPIARWCPWSDGSRCATEMPALLEASGGHDVRCHYVETLKSAQGSVAAGGQLAGASTHTNDAEVPGA